MTDLQQEATDETAPAGSSRHPLLSAARIVIAIAVLAAVVYAAVVEWDSVARTLRALSWKSLIGSEIAVILGMLATVKTWQHLLAALGTKVSYRAAAQVNLVGQLGKYLPGSVWAFVLQTQLGRRYKIPRARALVGLLLSAGLSVVSALTLAVFAARPLSHSWGNWAWLLALGPLSLLALIPQVLTRIANLALRLMRKPLLPSNLLGRQLLLALLWSFLSWLFFGAQLWLLTGSLARQSWVGFAICTGGFALAMSAGFLAFILPSGVGVREAVIVGALVTLATSGQALAIALVSRLLFTVADICTAGIALADTRLTARRAEEHHAVTVHNPGD
jgi:uncharacterized membrane protein YbhN (UPF0104 family)